MIGLYLQLWSVYNYPVPPSMPDILYFNIPYYTNHTILYTYGYDLFITTAGLQVSSSYLNRARSNLEVRDATSVVQSS